MNDNLFRSPYFDRNNRPIFDVVVKPHMVAKKKKVTVREYILSDVKKENDTVREYVLKNAKFD